MPDKKSFVLYSDSIGQWAMLSDEQAGILIKSLLLYAKSGERLQTDDGMLMMAFSFMSTQIDRDAEKWDKTCERRAEAAKKRWSKLKEQKNANDTIACNCMQSNANDAIDTIDTDNDTDTDNDNDNDNENDTDTDNEINNINNIYSASAESEFPVFDEAWKMFPEKKGKNAVSKKAKKEIEKAGLETITQAISAYMEDVQQKRNTGFDLRYMYGSTFFNGRWMEYLQNEQQEDESSEKKGGKYQ